MTGETTLRRWLSVAVVAMVGIVLSLPLYLVRERWTRKGGAAPDPAAPTFVGRETCRPCHEEAYGGWLGSHHDRAMDLAAETTVRGDFDDAEFQENGITSRFFRKNGRYFVHTEGATGEMADFEISHTFGWEPLQQYLVPFPGGRLQALTIAWDTEKEEWFSLYPGQDVPPGDWLHWTRNGQNWNGMCAECHSTDLVKGYDADSDTYRTVWSEIDVSCEACHGPGSRHVAWAELPAMARPGIEGFGLAVPTGDLSNDEYVDLCAPCHSRRAELGDVEHAGTDLLDKVLPSVLQEGLYHADGQILEEVYVYGSFVQSKMYRNGVSCGDCHDSHSLELLLEGNELCGQCHRADVYDSQEHHFHQEVYGGEASEAALCVKCHMVELPFMVVDWRADHSFRVPRPDLTAEIGTPNACGQGGCHDDKPLAWSLRAWEEWYGQARKPHFGQIFAAARSGEPGAREGLLQIAGDPLYPDIVRATALSLLARYPSPESTAAYDAALMDTDPLIRNTALANLSAPTPERVVALVSPLLFDPVRAVRIEAANRLAGIPTGTLPPYQDEALAAGLDEYRGVQEAALDFPSAAYNLGTLSGRMGNLEEAERYLRMALEIDELFAPAKVNLALLLNATGRNEEAESLLREVLEAYPDQSETAYDLGLLLAETDRMEEAVEFLGRASDGMPARGRVHYNYGLALQSVSRFAEAEAAFLHALGLDPENLDFLLVTADHYLRTGDATRALEMAQRLLELSPDHPGGLRIRDAALGSLNR
jgi:tetratricopeptide (TPR) repeat protein